jgi:hypothetical protein
VIPLGTQGRSYSFLDTLGQVVALRDTDLARDMALLGLFGGDDRWLYYRFPVTKLRKPDDGDEKVEEVVGWNHRQAGKWLIRQATRCGVIYVSDELRGLGAWADEEGRVVVHCGDAVQVDGDWRPPGRIGNWLYGADRRIDRPALSPLTPQEGQRLLALLGRWDLDGPAVMPRLLLGWIAAATMPGALPFRPSVWFVGPKETGKTTLQALISRLLGSTAEFVTQFSEPAVRQTLGMNSKALLIDEFEAPDKRELVPMIMELVRGASSGHAPKVIRGSGDGRSVATALYTVFAFSSIYMPPLTPQDRSRLTIVDLRRLTADPAQEATFRKEMEALARLGPRFRRRCYDAFPRLAPTMAVYSSALAEVGHRGRSNEHLSVMLAFAHLVLSDGPPDIQDARDHVRDLRAEVLAETREELADHEEWLHHLCASPHPMSWGGGLRPTIGALIQRVLNNDTEGHPVEQLAALGLKVEQVHERRQGGQDVGLGRGPWLMVANRHPTLASVFKGHRFEAVEWRHVLKHCSDAYVGGQTRFGKQTEEGANLSCKAMAVHLHALPLGLRFDETEH